MSRSHAEEMQALWTRFEEGPLTLPETPGVREAWHKGRTRFAVWIIRLDDASVRERVARVARGLGETIAPQPPADLHVTLFVAGFPCEGEPRWDDDIALSALQAQADELARTQTRFSLSVGGAHSFLSAPFLEVLDPGQQLASLRARLAKFSREVRFAPYCPHVTIGRYCVAVDTQSIAQSLRGARLGSPLPIEVAAVELVTLDPRRSDAPLFTERVVRLPRRW